MSDTINTTTIVIKRKIGSWKYAKDLLEDWGDWKKSSKGADGYLLVTVGEKSYWADAIGQIPFAVDTMRLYIKKI